MFFATGGGEEAAEKKIEGLGVNFGGSELELFEGGGLEETLERVEIKLNCEIGMDVVANHAGELALFDEAAENVGDIFLTHVVEERVEVRGKTLEVARGVGRDGVQALRQALGETAKFFGKIQATMTQKSVGFSPDFAAKTEDHIANQRVFAGEVLVEGFFTNPEFGCDGVHGDSAVTAG